MATIIPGPVGDLYVDDAGSGGIPVLFAHSYAGSCAHWRAQLAHLRLRRRAIAFDLRGHGHSDAPAAPDYSVGALGDDIAAVADALELRRFVLVGHSMGGSAACAYLERHPRRVAGIVLAGTPGKADARAGAAGHRVAASRLRTGDGQILVVPARRRAAAGARAARSRPTRDRPRTVARDDRGDLRVRPVAGARRLRRPQADHRLRRVATAPRRCTRRCPTSRARSSKAPAIGRTWTSPRSSTACSTSSSPGWREAAAARRRAPCGCSPPCGPMRACAPRSRRGRTIGSGRARPPG